MILSVLRTQSVRLAAALLLAGFVLTGCEAPTSALIDAETSSTLEEAALSTADLTMTLTQELNLTPEQQASIHADMQRHGSPDVTPGNLWYLSARLQGYLDERQKEKLFRIASRLDDRQLHKLVGVYAPCIIERPGDEDRPRPIRFHLIADLLSDEQRSQIEEIRASYSARIRALNEEVQEGTLTREGAVEQIRSLHEAAEAEIRAILSDDQIAALEEREAARGRHPENHVQFNRDAMIAALDLRDVQVAELDALHRTQCEALEALVRELHAEEITRDAFKEGLERLVRAKLSSYDEIMNEDQFTTSKIHDALVIVNARRYVNHVAGVGAGRPGGPHMGRPHAGRPHGDDATAARPANPPHGRPGFQAEGSDSSDS
ncbi:MAG: hypothetical protein WD423_10385 [Rhodothermales bacterium]